jgi:hypothetical protein
MAKNSSHNPDNFITNGMGIPAHDFLINTWSGTNLVRMTYKLGGSAGKIVAIIDNTYDVNNNLITCERTL